MILVAVPVVFEVAFLFILNELLNEADRQIQAERHARQVHEHLAALMKLLVDSGTGAIRYGLVGQQSHLKYKNPADVLPYEYRQLEALTKSKPVEYNAILQIEDILNKSVDEIRQVKALCDDGDWLKAKEILNQVKPILSDVDTRIERIMSQYERVAEASPQDQEKTKALVRYLLVAGVIFNIVIAFMLAAIFNRGITRRLGILEDNTLRLAAGRDLNPTMRGDDEIAHLDQFFKKMADALKDAARKERAIIENAVDVICSLDSTGRLEKISPASLKVFGYAPDDLLGTNLRELIVTEDIAKTNQAIEDIKGGKIEHGFENRVKRKDGEIIHCLWSADWSKAEKSLFCVVHDISARKKAENQLREAEARIRLIIETMPIGLVIIDEEGRIELINPTIEKMFGYGFEELRKNNLLMLLSQTAELGGEPMSLKMLFARAVSHAKELDGLRKAGGTFPLEISLNPFETLEGKRYLAVIIDVTQRHEVEKLKQDFVAMVSHELRSPLNSVLGFLEMLPEGVYGDLTELGKEKVAVADRNITRLIRLINDLLDIEKLEAGRLSMDITDTALLPVLERAVEAVRVLAEKQKVTIDVPKTSITMPIDGDRLVQVLVNLLSNAIKYSPPDSAVVLKINEKEDWIEIRVEDHGRGIPKSYREIIFERFQQVNTPGFETKGGTGLGLAICKAIVEQHGGAIGVDSDEGQGSSFWFRLPRKQSELIGATFEDIRS